MNNYDNWKCGWDEIGYDDQLDTYIENQYVKKSELPDLNEVKLALIDLMNILYDVKPIDLSQLDNLCCYVCEEMNLPVSATMPLIERTRIDLEFLK